MKLQILNLVHLSILILNILLKNYVLKIIIFIVSLNILNMVYLLLYHFEYLSNRDKYTTIIETVYNSEEIINKNKLQSNKNLLIFGATGGGFEIFIDLNTMIIYTLE